MKQAGPKVIRNWETWALSLTDDALRDAYNEAYRKGWTDSRRWDALKWQMIARGFL